MARKLAFAASALALGLFAAAPSWAISEETVPTNSDGTPRFSDSDSAPITTTKTFTTDDGGQATTTTQKMGGFTFGVTTYQGNGPGFANRFNNGNPSGFSNQSPFNQGPPNSPNTAPNFGPSGSYGPNSYSPYWPH